MPSSDQRPYHAQPRFAGVTPLSRPTPETTQRRDSGPGTPARRLVPDGAANPPWVDIRDRPDYRRGCQSGDPLFPSARQPTSGAGEPEATRRCSRTRRNYIRPCVFLSPLIPGICGRYAVTSFERNDPYLRHFDKIIFISKNEIASGVHPGRRWRRRAVVKSNCCRSQWPLYGRSGSIGFSRDAAAVLS